VDVEGGAADVAIQVGARPTHGQIVARRLARDVLTLFCSRAYAEAHGLPRGPEELEGHTILLGSGLLGDAPVYTWLREAASGAVQGYPASSVSAHIASVRAGAGIGVMPRRLFGDDPELVACFDAPAEHGIETWLVAPERLRDEPAVRALLDFIGGYRGQTPAQVGRR
jgi:DNA-binding transcriptional LysR family regulator